MPSPRRAGPAPRAGWITTVALLAASALAGAAGLASEGLLLSGAGLVLGHGRATALGLAVWIAAWALGAWIAGRRVTATRRALFLWGSAAALAAPLALHLALLLARSALGESVALVAGILVVALAALPQGAFLPLLARASRAAQVSALLGANLLGAVVGARWIGFDLPAAWGRPAAAWCAGGLALAAGILGALRSPREFPQAVDRTHHGSAAAPRSGALSARRAGAVVALATAWMAGVEWIAMRLGSLWLGGMQPAIVAVLAASLLSLAAGAALLPCILPRDAAGVAWALALAAVGGLYVTLGPGAGLVTDPEATPLLAALAIAAPALVPLGAVLPTLYRSLEGESGRRLGDLLLYEVWGALLGVPLVHLWLVPTFGIGGALGALALLALPAWALLAPAVSGRMLVAAGCVAIVSAGATFAGREPALASPKLSDPAFEVLSFVEDRHFAVTVVEDGARGERALLTDSFRATSTGPDYDYMRVLGHLPLLLHPAPRRVGVLAFGTGTTAGAVARHPEVQHIDVFELSAAVCDTAPFFEEVNGGVLDDRRTRLHLGDGRRTLARLEGELDVLTMEPLLPDSPFAIYLYTREFYRRARASLAPGGLVCQWVPPQALEPVTFDAVIHAFTRAFDASAVLLFGTQVVLVGGEELPPLSPARFPLADEPLHDHLAALGIADAAGIAARFVVSGGGWPENPRSLTDADPWVIYRRRPLHAGFTNLPLNLGMLRRREEPPPSTWTVAAGAAGLARVEAIRTLRRAREAWSRVWEVERRGLELPSAPALEPIEVYVARLDGLQDPEVRRFGERVQFQRAYQAGWDSLVLGEPRVALELFREAQRLRPRRAAVHLHAALAAHRAGEPQVARELADLAYELCPRLLETPEGVRLSKLGLPAGLLRQARENAHGRGP